MRVRMIRPAYWTDADLHTRLNADQREFYIGLWMMADDAGFVAWDVDRVGAELYPYRAPGWRARQLPKWVELLGDHVQVLECGRHLLVPNLSRYNSPPKPSYPNKKSHDACLRHMAPHGTTGDLVAPAREGKGREGGLDREGKGFEEGARGANGLTTDEEATTLGRKIAAMAS